MVIVLKDDLRMKNESVGASNLSLTITTDSSDLWTIITQMFHIK